MKIYTVISWKNDLDFLVPFDKSGDQDVNIMVSFLQFAGGKKTVKELHDHYSKLLKNQEEKKNVNRN